MKPKAFIYGEQPHKELSIHEVPLWSFNDKDNVHEIENWKQMAEEIVATRGSLNNHLIYSQEDYPGIINDASKIEPVAKVSRIRYDEDTKTFIADITSTNQQFIEMIAATEFFPRVHPCYEAETNPRFVGYLTTVSSTFKRLLCWLVEPTKLMNQKISVEYHPEGRTDESENGNNDVMNNSPRVSTADEIPLPKEEVFKAILKNIQPVLDGSISDDGKYGWNYGERANTFYWRIHKLKTMLQIGASLVFDIENKSWVWEIHTHNTSNVNVKVYANKINIRDESCSNYDDFSFDFMHKIIDDIDKRLGEYNQKYRNVSKSDADNEKADRWETMRHGINKTLNSFCDKLISNSIVGGSYKRTGSLRRVTLGEKTIDFILQFDADLDSWIIFIGDLTHPRIVINANEHIVADISAFIPDPLCFRDIQTLCDMLGVCRNNNWQVKEATYEERMNEMNELKAIAEKNQMAIVTGHQFNRETSDDKEEASKLIPKEELIKIIFENIKDTLELNLSENKYSEKYQLNSWSLSVYADDSFRYVISDRQKYTAKSIGCDFHKDHWDIFTNKVSNVNLVVYPDEARWMTDDPLFRNPHKDFPKDVLENIITDINAWIKTKTMPNKELSAFSQSLIKDGKRPSKVDYYLAMAEVASTRGTCLRRRFGSVIVKDDRIVSTGYVGAPSGRQNCCDIGYCFREANNIPSGTMYERCRSSHSEMNAIINASKEEMKDATLYLVGVEPDGKYTKANCCAMCKKVIINSGISKVIARQSADEYIEIDVDDWKKNDDSLNSNHKGY